MNVFVLCTGRCGSTTFVRACGHMTNFSAGHESRARRLGGQRLAYPERHIEADNRLSWMLGRLDRQYGDGAYYVHLTRDPETVAASYARRTKLRVGILPAYKAGILMHGAAAAEGEQALEVAKDLVATVTANIEHFLRDKTHVMSFPLEEATTRFPVFWDWIGAEGDRERALAEFGVRHNAARG